MKKVTKIAETASSKVKLKKIRVAAYCRVSTDSDAQLESLEAQKTHYENYITSRDDWEFAGLYYDEGITGTKKDKRAELLRLIDDCKAGKVDFVITKSISRFSRNTTDCLELVRKLLALHIPIYFEKENINTGSMESELFLAILSSMAEKIIVLCTDEPTSLTDAYAFIKIMAMQYPKSDLNVVINQANSIREGQRTYDTLLKACTNFLKINPPLLGIIRRDTRVRDAIRNQTPLINRFPTSEAAEDVIAIARKLITE